MIGYNSIKIQTLCSTTTLLDLGDDGNCTNRQGRRNLKELVCPLKYDFYQLDSVSAIVQRLDRKAQSSLFQKSKNKLNVVLVVLAGYSFFQENTVQTLLFREYLFLIPFDKNLLLSRLFFDIITLNYAINLKMLRSNNYYDVMLSINVVIRKVVIRKDLHNINI